MYSGYQQPSSSREALSLFETAALHVRWASQGLQDALRIDRTITVIQEDPEIRANALKSLILNILSVASVGAFDFFILPLLDPRHEKFVHRHFGALYQAFWLAPLVTISLWLNVTWCSAIASRTFALRVGRQAISSSPYSGLVAQVASSAYRGILILSYLILTFLLTYVPYLGAIASFIYICWVNSYYCFEYSWIARGMTLSQRVKYEEERWAYYLAFGFPSAFICMWASSLGNAAIFALIYPVLIIQAIHATPLPANPHTPEVDSYSGVTAIPNPYIPVRLPIFAPVIIVNDGIVKLLSVAGTSRSAKRSLGLRTISGDGDFEGVLPMSPVGGTAGGGGYGSPGGYGYGGGGRSGGPGYQAYASPIASPSSTATMRLRRVN